VRADSRRVQETRFRTICIYPSLALDRELVKMRESLAEAHSKLIEQRDALRPGNGEAVSRVSQREPMKCDNRRSKCMTLDSSSSKIASTSTGE
jgi:hypothetical protein